jgi:ribosomal protein S8E
MKEGREEKKKEGREERKKEGRKRRKKEEGRKETLDVVDGLQLGRESAVAAEETALYHSTKRHVVEHVHEEAVHYIHPHVSIVIITIKIDINV